VLGWNGLANTFWESMFWEIAFGKTLFYHFCEIFARRSLPEERCFQEGYLLRQSDIEPQEEMLSLAHLADFEEVFTKYLSEYRSQSRKERILNCLLIEQ